MSNTAQMTKEAGCEIDQIENILARNQRIVAEFDSANEGSIKCASTAAGSNMIRRRIREAGFTRRIIPMQTVTNAELNRDLNHDRPLIIEDMEPLSKGAKSCSFGDSADSQTFYGNKYAVVFNPYTTPEWTKDINELRTYKMDLRQVITDNSLNDVQTTEDGSFITLCNTIVGQVGGVGLAGVAQNFNIAGGITRDTYPEALNKLEDLKLNNGVVLMNRRTAKEFLKWDRSEIGGDLAQELFKNGLSALQEATINGVKHIFTIKSELVPNGTIFVFTEPGYLGKFYELSPLTMYVEKKKDILRFSARETLGLTVANVAGIARINFQL
jgi:hypothetical protein